MAGEGRHNQQGESCEQCLLDKKQAKDSTVKGNYRPVLLLITDGKYSVKCFLKIGGTQ